MRLRFAIVFLLLAATARAAVIDDFDDVSRWTAAPSDGVSLNLVADNGATNYIRIDWLNPAGNTNLREYDVVGRQYYVAVRAKF